MTTTTAALAKIEAIANADAHATNAGLPSYTDLLVLEDYRNVARNVVEPQGY